MRIARVLALVFVIAAVAVPVAAALDFTEGVDPPDGTVGTPYSFQFQAVSGCKPYTFSILAGALPAGLSMTPGGLISGTPTAAGDVSFWAELKDNCGRTSQELFTIRIAPALIVSTASPLAPALVGVPYSVQFTAAGGGTQGWFLVGGSLSPGFSFSAGGLLSGTATAALPAPVKPELRVPPGDCDGAQGRCRDGHSPFRHVGGDVPLRRGADRLGRPRPRCGTG